MTDTFAPSTNGVVRSVESTGKAFRALGVDYAVIAPGTVEVRARARDSRVAHYPAMETTLYPGLHLGVRPVRRRDVEGFDVVHVHTPGPLGISALVAARRAGVKSVFTHHTRFDEMARLSAPRWLRSLAVPATELVDRAILSLVDRVVAPSVAVREHLWDRHGRESIVVPTGVDLQRFRPSDARRTNPGPRFLHAGRIAREKNLEVVLRAFAIVREQLPDAQLIVAGDGPDAARCRALAPPGVSFLGHVPEGRLVGTYQAADAFVCASTFETQGLTVLEAMACGKPAALADVPVFRGLPGAALFDPRDHVSVAEQMLIAYQYRAELGAAAARHARTMGTYQCAQALLAAYRSRPPSDGLKTPAASAPN